jgi:hypothetical protein
MATTEGALPVLNYRDVSDCMLHIYSYIMTSIGKREILINIEVVFRAYP